MHNSSINFDILGFIEIRFVSHLCSLYDIPGTTCLQDPEIAMVEELLYIFQQIIMIQEHKTN